MSHTVRYDDLRQYAAARAALLDRLVVALRADQRIRAAWLEGSFGHDAADDWSDLDVHLAVADEQLPAFLAQADHLFGQLGTVVLRYDEPRNAPAGGAFALVVYQGALEVDWSIGPVRTAQRPRRSRLLFDQAGIPSAELPPPLSLVERQQHAARRVAFFWAMAPTALKYVGRQQTPRSVGLISMLTEALIEVWRLVHVPDGPDPSRFQPDRSLEPELAALVPRLGQTLDAAAALAVIRGLGAEMVRLHPALTAFGVAVPEAAVAEIATLAGLVEQTIGDL